MFRRKIALTFAFSLLLSQLGGLAFAEAKPKKNVDDRAVFTFIHAIPSTFGADKVDVYSNGQLIFDNATPGSLKSFAVSPGEQQISVYADGITPTTGTASILSYRSMYLPKYSNVSYVAHLSANNTPTLSLFKNMNTEPGKKRSWLTVRHIAGAPTVDVRANAKLLFRALSNTDERKISLKFGTYSVDIVLTGTATVAIPASNLVVKNNTNYIVYAWGSVSKANLQFLIQEVASRNN